MTDKLFWERFEVLRQVVKEGKIRVDDCVEINKWQKSKRNL